MALLVDMNPALGVDLQDDEATLVNGSASSTVEGGVYVVDPATGTALDSSGSYKYTGVKTVGSIGSDDMRIGMFVVSKGKVEAGANGRFVGFAQMQVLISAINGQVNPGDLLMPVIGQNYLVRATGADLAGRRAVARASRTVTSTTASLQWCYFAGLMPFFGSADTTPGIIDSSMSTMYDRGIVLVNYVDYTGGEFSANGGYVAAAPVPILFPTGRVNRPRLQPGCMVTWDVQGLITRADATVQTYRLEPVINGVALPISIDHVGAAGAINYPGIIRIQTEMYCISQDGMQGGTWYYRFDTRVRIYSDVDALSTDTSTCKRSTVFPAAGSINPTIDNDIGWRFTQRTDDSGHNVWLTNFLATLNAFRTGV